MTILRNNTQLFTPVTVGTVGKLSLNDDALYITAAPASTAFDAVNRAVYTPVFIPTACTVDKVWWANGGTVNAASNVEVGIYSDNNFKPGSKIISGSATQGTASTVQYVDVTNTLLGSGKYWIAFVCDSITTTTFFRSAVALHMDASIKYLQESAYPLPSTATPAVNTTLPVWICGFQTL